MKNKRILLLLAAVCLLLSIPALAMQFTDEVNWNVFDFTVMGILLIGTALICEIILRKIKSLKARIMICSGILFALFLIWVELAVGIFGTPFAGS
jgi:peptidoglycan/LPS O-acetylase OafA/YrhL